MNFVDFDLEAYGVILAGETICGSIGQQTRQLGMVGRVLGRMTCRGVLGVLPGREVRGASDEWGAADGLDVLGLESDWFDCPNPELYANAITQIADRTKPSFVVFPHTMRHCAVAAKVAVSMRAACVTAVESVVMDAGTPVFIRSVLGGKHHVGIRPETPGVVMTCLPGVHLPDAFGHEPSDGAEKTGRVWIQRMDEPDDSFVPVRMENRMPPDNALKDAEVILSGGRGMGEDGIRLLFETAKLFKRAAVGGSRIACDLGWLPHSRQIGETGRSVSPKLYIACGISGASQHLAGITSSQTIVAVNTDPHAPIFNAANLGIIEDARTFLPLLTNMHGKSEKT